MESEASSPGDVVEPGMGRGGCLSAFLALMILVNAFTALLYLGGPRLVSHPFPGAPHRVLLLLGLGALLNILFAILVWQWRRVGVYGFVAIALLVFPLNLHAGVPVFEAAFGLLGPVLLVGAVWTRWARFV